MTFCIHTILNKIFPIVQSQPSLYSAMTQQNYAPLQLLQMRTCAHLLILSLSLVLVYNKNWLTAYLALRVTSSFSTVI